MDLRGRIQDFSPIQSLLFLVELVVSIDYFHQIDRLPGSSSKFQMR